MPVFRAVGDMLAPMIGFSRRRLLARLAAVALAALALAGSAQAQTRRTPVDLVLVLAVDASGSITDDRWELERQGYAKAFRDPVVVKAITSGPIGAIAVTMVQWSGKLQQSQVIGWTVVSDVATAEGFAKALAGMPHYYRSWTSINWGLAFSARLLRNAPYDAPRRVIDVSGDGPDSTSELIIQGTQDDAADLRETRDRIVAEGFVINGLPIFGDPRIRAIDFFYEMNVIGGPGSFQVVADDFASFATAVRRKLLLEIAGRGTVPWTLAFRD
jgi:hypothetical protein